jgi:hypothetical protein
MNIRSLAIGSLSSLRVKDRIDAKFHRSFSVSGKSLRQLLVFELLPDRKSNRDKSCDRPGVGKRSMNYGRRAVDEILSSKRGDARSGAIRYVSRC